MNCTAECCIECYSIFELFQVWIEITVEISVRVTIQLLRNGPLVIVIIAAGYTYYYLETWHCGRAEVVTGNTIKIRGKHVRIYGIVAPQRGQEICWDTGECKPGSVWSKQKLAEKIKDKRVCCRVTDWHGAYQRVEGVCYLRGEDIGKWMVREGYAFADTGFSDRYVKDQEYARQNENGFHGAAPPPAFPKDRKIRAERDAREFLVRAYQAKRLPGDPAVMTISELSVEVGVDLNGGILIDPSDALNPIEL